MSGLCAIADGRRSGESRVGHRGSRAKKYIEGKPAQQQHSIEQNMALSSVPAVPHLSPLGMNHSPAGPSHHRACTTVVASHQAVGRSTWM
jgi:hypothetical protein